MTEELLRELKQLDDKIILTEVFLLESRAAHAIQNLPRAKVRLACIQEVLMSRRRSLPLARQRIPSTVRQFCKHSWIFKLVR